MLHLRRRERLSSLPSPQCLSKASGFPTYVVQNMHTLSNMATKTTSLCGSKGVFAKGKHAYWSRSISYLYSQNPTLCVSWRRDLYSLASKFYSQANSFGHPPKKIQIDAKQWSPKYSEELSNEHIALSQGILNSSPGTSSPENDSTLNSSVPSSVDSRYVDLCARKPKLLSRTTNSKAQESSISDDFPDQPNTESSGPELPETTAMVESQNLLQETPSFSPNETILRFQNMKHYCQRMSQLLFAEEELSLGIGTSLLFDSDTFEVGRLKDPKLKQRAYALEIMLTPELQDRFRKFGQHETGADSSSGSDSGNIEIDGQTVILISGDRELWFGYVSRFPKTEPKSKQVARAGSKKVCIKLYHWSRTNLPQALKNEDLKIMFVSSQANKMFKAISRAPKSPFADLLMGESKMTELPLNRGKTPENNQFNLSQKLAVQSVLQRSFTLVQGPPGTGKTSTIYEMVIQLLAKKQFPILVVAASNVAVDNLAEKLLSSHSKSIMRLTAGSKEAEYGNNHVLAPICFHRRFYEKTTPEIRQIMDSRLTGSFRFHTRDTKKVRLAKQKFLREMLPHKKMVFTTTSAASALFQANIKKWPVLIMDEATQSSEPATLIPLTLPGLEKLVLVGDQKQLSSTTNVKGLSLSLFERVLRNGAGKSRRMLDTQYRMHPAISKFPRENFYGNRLKDGASVLKRNIKGLPQNPVLFWDTCGKSPEHSLSLYTTAESHRTYSNPGEARRVEQIVTHLIQKLKVSRSSIGIVTPYRGQRNQICSLLMQNQTINPQNESVRKECLEEEFTDASERATLQYISGIMLASVDAFQGREKDFIVMSCVRSNDENSIGFLGDRRRLNVALTRAKHGLILVGDSQCLRKSSKLWEDYISHLKSNGSLLASPRLVYGD